MHFKIDFELNPLPSHIPDADKIKIIRDKLAQELGNYILQNSDFITDEDLKPKRTADNIYDDKICIRKDLLIFTDVSRFVKTLMSERDKQRLLETNF
jgi:hypothetical protein